MNFDDKSYHVAVEWNKEALQNTVNFAIKGGWVPQGGIALAYSPGGSLIYAQALTKKSNG